MDGVGTNYLRPSSSGDTFVGAVASLTGDAFYFFEGSNKIDITNGAFASPTQPLSLPGLGTADGTGGISPTMADNDASKKLGDRR